MNKVAIMPLVAFIILCPVIAQSLPSFASYTSARAITASGIIEYNVIEPTKTRKHIIAYVGTFTTETANFIASHFDVVIAGFEAAPTVGRIKDSNPDTKILGYKDIMAISSDYPDYIEVNANEDWFLHDIHGNRLVNAYWGWYAMDVGNNGWRSYYANFVKDKLNNCLSFDGVFADDALDTFPAGSGWNPWTVPIEDVPVEIKNRWHSDMLEMIKFVKATLGEKLLILNNPGNFDYVDACDGRMEEGFVHPYWWASDEFYSEIEWKSRVDNLKRISQNGKYSLEQSGTAIPENPTEADLEKVHIMLIYCLASYFLGTSGEKATFGFNTYYSNDGSKGYYPEFDVLLGSPMNEYYSLGSVYSRDFERGKVLVNPTQSSHAIDLESEFKTMDGQTVSSVTLSAHSGIILLNP